MWAKHPKISEAWSHGKSSVTGKKEGKAKNTGLPYHKSKRDKVVARLNKKGLQKNYS